MYNVDVSNKFMLCIFSDEDQEEALKPKLTFNPHFQRLYQVINIQPSLSTTLSGN